MHAARPSSPGYPAHLACISAAHAATGPCCASTTDDVAAIVRKDTAAILVNRKLDRAVMSRLLWTLVFRLEGEYLSQVSWAATPSPALVGNPKTHWSEILRQRPVLEPAILPRTVPVPPKATFASAKQMSALGQGPPADHQRC